jgi:hypothetical protein
LDTEHQLVERVLDLEDEVSRNKAKINSLALIIDKLNAKQRSDFHSMMYWTFLLVLFDIVAILVLLGKASL